MMKCRNDAGRELDANFSVEADDAGFRITLDSRGGAAKGPTPSRNADYVSCLELLLTRAGRLSCDLSMVEIASRPAMAMTEAKRRVTLPDHPYPISLATVDVAALRQAMGRVSADFGREARGTGGNPTKKLRLHLTFGSLASKAAEEIGFILSRSSGTDSRSGETDRAWTHGELRACVEGYRTLWLAQKDGVKADKATLRRNILSDALRDRSPGSYEFRMQNVSAVVEDLGIPIVTGYLPRRNIGRAKAALIAMIGEVWDRNGIAEQPTADPRQLETRVEAAALKMRSGVAGAPAGVAAPTRIGREAQRFIRDPNVIAWVLQAAAGRCESCSEPAPFQRDDGTPYLEVHHVRPLADGGPDTINNAVAVCPNCHRGLHHGVDAAIRRSRLMARLERIVDHPRREVGPAPRARPTPPTASASIRRFGNPRST